MIMRTYVITANKTKMVSLLRGRGYRPSVRTAHFSKLYHRRSYTLIWKEPSGQFDAYLSAVSGKPILRITHAGVSKSITLSIAELDQYNMTEEFTK